MNGMMNQQTVSIAARQIEEMKNYAALGNAIGGAPQSVKETTVTSLANDLADAIVELRACLNSLREALSPVCYDHREPGAPFKDTVLPALAVHMQLHALIEQVNEARWDVQGMFSGLRV